MMACGRGRLTLAGLLCSQGLLVLRSRNHRNSPAQISGIEDIQV